VVKRNPQSAQQPRCLLSRRVTRGVVGVDVLGVSV